MLASSACGMSQVRDDAARPQFRSESTSTTIKTAMIDAIRGKAASVQLPDGTRLSLPAGAIMSSAARLSIAQSDIGVYDARIEGDWQGRADVRLPARNVDPPGQAFLLAKADKGWEVAEAEWRPDGFLYASLPSVSLLKALSCDAKVVDGARAVLGCLAGAGVLHVPDGLARSIATGLGCGAPWPETTLLSKDVYCMSSPTSPVPTAAGATGGGSGVPTPLATPKPAPANPAPATTAATTTVATTPPTTAAPAVSPAAPAGTRTLQVSLSEDPVHCDGSRRSFGTILGAQPGETIEFSSPGIESLLPGRADSSGMVTMHWVCSSRHVGWTWSMSAVGTTSERTVTFEFRGGAGA
jgi:hypothetical protein